MSTLVSSLTSNLHALVIGAAGSAIAYYAIKAIERYLARQTIRGRQRQIQPLTQGLQLLKKLGVTDRSLLLFAFQVLFTLIGVIGVGIAGSIALLLVNEFPDNPAWMVLLLMPAIVALIGLWAASVFKKLEDPQPTLAK